MNEKPPTENDLRDQLHELREHFPKLKDDELFLVWFLRAFITESEDEAVKSLTGISRDKGIDAVFIDEPARIVFIIQSKYRQKFNEKQETRQDVMQFAQLAGVLYGEHVEFSNFIKSIDTAVRKRLEEARERLLKRKYRLQLYYVSPGKISKTMRDEAYHTVRCQDSSASFDAFDGKRLIFLLRDYLDGVAPPVPSLDLEIETGQGVRVTGILNRFDAKTEIESWVFPMSGESVGQLYEFAGVRLFARNVRGYLGNSDINHGMDTTIEKEPQFFWYYNNGITIVCDRAEQITSRGRGILRVDNPQIINGQQTTRTLHRNLPQSAKASVVVRVIRVPRDKHEQSNGFDALVSRIVAATNWQNQIRQSDLMSNDRRQIEIDRALRKFGYCYVRKRQTKGEMLRTSGVRSHHFIKKEQLAQAVAGCDLDPLIVREGKENLFDEEYYSQVFPTADPYYYLTRYCTFCAVTYAARGYPERGYAKWVVLNFIWSRVAPLVRSKQAADCFHQSWFRSWGSMQHLIAAVDAVFKAGLQFYRVRRGKGAKAIDVSSFFKRKNLHVDFERFWEGSTNQRKGAFKRAWTRYERKFREEVAS
jgi:hypothetical protein